jgi:hypothetical protein
MFETLRAIGRAILPNGKKEEVSLQSATVHAQSAPPKKDGGMLSGSVHLPPPPNEHLIRFTNDGVEVPPLTDAQYEQLKKKIDALYTGTGGADQQKVTEGAPEDIRLKIKLTKKGDRLVLDLNDLMDETGAKSVNIRFKGSNITLGGNNSSVVIGSGNAFSSSCSVSGNDYMKVGDDIEMDGDYMRVGDIEIGRKKRKR